MPALLALLLAVAISLLIGAGLYSAIRKPLENLMAQYCMADSAVAFWARFTLVMLFLAPLFIAIAFGLPPAEALPKVASTTIISRVVTASLTGGFLAMICMGIWVSTLARRFPAHSAAASSTPESGA